MRRASSGWIYDGETRKEDTRAVAHYESRSTAATFSQSLENGSRISGVEFDTDVALLVDGCGAMIERRWTRYRLTR